MARFFALVLIVLTIGATTAHSQEKTITVFAAASLKNALDDVDAAFTKQTGVKVISSYDASSALMKQIEAGAPADAFLSADLKWMDYGVEKKVINESTRINLLGNVLVLMRSIRAALAYVACGEGAARHRLCDRCQDRPRRKSRRRLPRQFARSDHLSGGGDGERQTGDHALSGASAFVGGQIDIRGVRLFGAGKTGILKVKEPNQEGDFHETQRTQSPQR
jgi:hypothetical protein